MKIYDSEQEEIKAAVDRQLGNNLNTVQDGTINKRYAQYPAGLGAQKPSLVSQQELIHMQQHLNRALSLITQAIDRF